MKFIILSTIMILHSVTAGAAANCGGKNYSECKKANGCKWVTTLYTPADGGPTYTSAECTNSIAGNPAGYEETVKVNVPPRAQGPAGNHPGLTKTGVSHSFTPH